jgi:hypothetical protein
VGGNEAVDKPREAPVARLRPGSAAGIHASVKRSMSLRPPRPNGCPAAMAAEVIEPSAGRESSEVATPRPSSPKARVSRPSRSGS